MKFKNKYRFESYRMPGWDYGGPGKYFVTILTKYRVRYFGDVRPRHKDNGDKKELDSIPGDSEIGDSRYRYRSSG